MLSENTVKYWYKMEHWHEIGETQMFEYSETNDSD